MLLFPRARLSVQREPQKMLTINQTLFFSRERNAARHQNLLPGGEKGISELQTAVKNELEGKKEARNHSPVDDVILRANFAFPFFPLADFNYERLS